MVDTLRPQQTAKVMEMYVEQLIDLKTLSVKLHYLNNVISGLPGSGPFLNPAKTKNESEFQRNN